ncbi:hypothetical protein G7Z17_g9616 [Cylindrodendrum hubeiense]|uniref:Uncharacterized protein n=1 Tax=Cylindrodendrum hubeiense TaxID=595255 RepID=A0A9P5H154_9HYPO|nr:hypothetical protein G7Z17_g9616 [Cylindrodendrum hubeiense]
MARADGYRAPPPSPMTGQERRLVVCVDYGATYSAAAWALTTKEAAAVDDIHVVRKWGKYFADKVPSSYAYSPNGNTWGYGVGNGAQGIRWSKLGLGPKSRLEAFTELRRAVEDARLRIGCDAKQQGEIPAHKLKSPSDVATDYLTEIATCVLQDVIANNDPQIIKQLPLDLVITHPVHWDYKAQNMLFRAANSAFQKALRRVSSGNDNPWAHGTIRLTTEPAACTQYMIRILQDQGLNKLKNGSCFTVVDAGGVTICNLTTSCSGVRCGASRIDDSFMRELLPQILGEGYIKLLNDSETEQNDKELPFVPTSPELQVMMDRFQPIKNQFSGPWDPDQRSREIALSIIAGFGDMGFATGGVQNGKICKDGLDNVTGEYDDIKWLIAKGDLISQDEGIQVAQGMVQKFGQGEKKAGTVTIVFTSGQGAEEKLEDEDGTRDDGVLTHDLAYDLTDEYRGKSKNTKNNLRSNEAEMRLSISVNLQSARIRLIQEDAWQAGEHSRCLDSIDFSFESPP